MSCAIRRHELTDSGVSFGEATRCSGFFNREPGVNPGLSRSGMGERRPQVHQHRHCPRGWEAVAVGGSATDPCPRVRIPAGAGIPTGIPLPGPRVKAEGWRTAPAGASNILSSLSLRLRQSPNLICRMQRGNHANREPHRDRRAIGRQPTRPPCSSVTAARPASTAPRSPLP